MPIPSNSLAQRWLVPLQQQRVIAVIRVSNLDLGLRLAEVAAEAGLQFIEITWNSDRPQVLIAQLRDRLPNCWIGAGTLLSLADLNQAIAAGAQFCFTPHTHPVLIEAAVTQAVPIIPGALSPTEIITAWQAGASSVKVFPINAVGGASYLRSLQGPLGHIPLIPTGGVTCANARELLETGAIAVGLSRALFPTDWVEAGQWAAIVAHIQQFHQNLLS
ncbi:bifunctional 4-hydroxy-2-oxoglutarate aldolase/2-dehydro-3-deoxy-phosphogluconate aldolase [Trichothermofontia sichuanensis B231]|uniref:bifunctional 4-hydroxy-2-oxoglutarate aldolase/2-dehydro-3-deoxy-phosphogluconate aldolase n=1 Tax=Trichothermofontia sichuanensis TaxID=3045816 RepID=UPI0022482C03|nr:bifunctional 4-hydroxy-2-oxoglutarate aldolase/2-dehydro-3-deoxy-phosphogluconate aldolase [Trichothermofontia sichuanensis]UZQ54171.1 bifunctional 4-hydroxy-2-oxoglutarate aldolase/2-dehydro-3-deoxy-phosphogluconate aldolase [Trichothermofontia sichuanensis B231]